MPIKLNGARRGFVNNGSLQIEDWSVSAAGARYLLYLAMPPLWTQDFLCSV
jgi:hypothetical protein